MNRTLGILVSGRGSNLRAILNSVKQRYIKDAKVGVVISNRDGVPALSIADEFKVKRVVIPSSGFAGDRWAYDRLLIDSLERNGVTRQGGLVILAGFDRILSEEFVKHYPNSLINIHPSLLPSFPGLHAQRQALEHGVKVSGCTVHFVVPEVDAGPIVLQKAVDVKEGDTEESLSDRILKEEHRLYPKAIKLIVEGKVSMSGRRVVISR